MDDGQVQEPEGKRGKTPQSEYKYNAWGPGRCGLRGIAQGRGFWRPRPRCFPRGYYELSVPGRRPGTFRAHPPALPEGADQTAPPSRGAGTPCTSPPGRSAPASGAETPASFCKPGLRVPAAAPPPAETTGTGGGGCARLQGRAVEPRPRELTLAPCPRAALQGLGVGAKHRVPGRIAGPAMRVAGPEPPSSPATRARDTYESPSSVSCCFHGSGLRGASCGWRRISRSSFTICS